MSIDERSALIIVDVQNDFLPGGSLAVSEGDGVIPVLNRYIERFEGEGGAIYATRDWHPEGHSSFASEGGMWPRHCVQGSKGAAFDYRLALPAGTPIVSKGTESDKEAYSGFQGTHLAETLRERGITRLYVGGLATDYCVKNTVLDGLQNGFETFYLADAAKGVEVNAGDVANAEREMIDAGAVATTLDDLANGHD